MCIQQAFGTTSGVDMKTPLVFLLKRRNPQLQGRAGVFSISGPLANC